MCSRLESYTESTAGLSKFQYGFRPNRSTIDAISKVCIIAKDALQGSRWLGGTKQYCAIITLDVKNAFNSASWSRIINALNNMHVPNYMLKLIVSYFTDRNLVYDTDLGPVTYNITGGVPQGSVLGPILWNVMYDGVFRLNKLTGVHIVGYADDVAIIGVAKTRSEVATKCNTMIATVKKWLQENELELAEHKTELVLLSSRRKVERVSIRVGGHTIESSTHLRYLGVFIDHRLCFKEHLKQAGHKAAKVCNCLSRIMPNVGGPNQSSRLLLASVSKSIMLYAAPIWAEAVLHKSYTRELKGAHRLANLRVCRAYRTVSDEAAAVLAGRLPIDLEVKAAEATWIRREQGDRNRNRLIETHVDEWQRQWDTAQSGRWTHSIIPDLRTWNERKHGKLNFYVTQFLSGHGCFRQYLHRFKHVSDPYCQFCADKVEGPEHAVSECVRFKELRRLVERLLNCRLSAYELVRQMLSSPEKWEIGSSYIKLVMIKLRQDDQAARANDVTRS